MAGHCWSPRPATQMSRNTSSVQHSAECSHRRQPPSAEYSSLSQTSRIHWKHIRNTPRIQALACHMTSQKVHLTINSTLTYRSCDKHRQECKEYKNIMQCCVTALKGWIYKFETCTPICGNPWTVLEHLPKSFHFFITTVIWSIFTSKWTPEIWTNKCFITQISTVQHHLVKTPPQPPMLHA